ncbi:Clp protease N-terminal domain-containing protein [Streptomyces sp. Ac-502]|uniref:Clp protease N-terminal domain-containing protein n=1 Tax=Streptomyces sp. Ac-502 TaxID=3342801 RepID=UPI0038625130
MFGAEKSPFVMAVKSAAEEARHRGDRRIGTEHLLLGLLAAANSTSIRVPGADVLGVDLATARAALADLDTAALRAIGLDVDEAPQAKPRRHPAVPATALTTSARAAINQAIKNTTRKNRNSQAPANSCSRCSPTTGPTRSRTYWTISAWTAPRHERTSRRAASTAIETGCSSLEGRAELALCHIGHARHGSPPGERREWPRQP